MSVDQGYINHIALVLDRSVSMSNLAKQVTQVTDNLVKTLAAQSQTHDQETRITVYLFGSRIDCVYYDKDVLRLPSLAGKYKIEGNTKLVSATLQAIRDLEKTATLYGDHSFMLFVLTDGVENESNESDRLEIRKKLASLPKEWTIACLVPNQMGIAEAKKWGFLESNIEKWDTTAQGVLEVGQKLERATNAYMTARSTGKFVGTANIFSLDPSSLSKAVSVGALDALKMHQYVTYRTGSQVEEIRPFVERMSGIPYKLGTAYYQLTKNEHVQPQKQIAVRDKLSGTLYRGAAARQLLNLPDYEVKVTPNHNSQYDIFIQSTSVNRKLMPSTDVLILG